MKLLAVAPLALALSASVFACSVDAQDGEKLFPEDRCTQPGTSCDAFGRATDATEREPAYELGTAERPAAMTLVHQSNPLWDPVDLEFNPRSPRDLWINNYKTGHMTVVKNIGTKQSQVIERRDVAWSHFQNKPPAFAFGSDSQWGQTWGTCGDGNNGGNFFMGPTLYTANLDIFGGNNPSTNLGSHLDMLHSTSYCRGITWAGEGNKYFAFNAYNKSIDFYDFAADHGPGWDDHADGVIRRYWTNQVKAVDGVISGLSYNAGDKKVYVADTGNKRILALDPSAGRFVSPFLGMEPIVERAFYEAPVVVVASTGLEQPSGIEASGDLVFTTDALTSQIHAISIKDGQIVRSFDTKLAPGSLAGLNFGPDGRIYFVDRKGGAVYRLDP